MLKQTCSFATENADKKMFSVNGENMRCWLQLGQTVYLAGEGLVGCCRLGVVLSDSLHVGSVIPVGGGGRNLEHNQLTVTEITITSQVGPNL